MVRVVVFLLFVAALATGLSWLADRPGSLLINWQGYEIRTSVFRAVVMLAILVGAAIMLWSIMRGIWTLPAGLGNFFNRRRERRGLEALSSGLLAIGSGDKSLATRYAVQARKSLPNEPLTHILRAQAAQMAGDRQTARRIFEAMLGEPETEPFGLRGLFLEAEREGETEAARQFAERAIEINPRLSWPVAALFDIDCKAGNWAEALKALAIARKHGHLDKSVADRRRAVLLTAQAQALEDTDPERALKLAEEAHKLANDLVPATAIAGRIAAARGNVQKATKILERGWRKQAHPDIATAFAHARIGDSPRDRLERVKKLAALSPHSIESPIAVAAAAIEAREFETARAVLAPLTDGRLTRRVCTLMARIEGEDGDNVGAVREWLARAVNAPRDPAWTADGLVADEWAPVSPVTGTLDAFQWRVPVEAAAGRDGAIAADNIEEFVKLGVRADAVTPASVAGSAADKNPGDVPAAGAAAAPAPVRSTAAVDADVIEPTQPAGSSPSKRNVTAPSATSSNLDNQPGQPTATASAIATARTSSEPNATQDQPTETKATPDAASANRKSEAGKRPEVVRV
ncbi:MAG: heme biosynthesis HemY N-terminal domain-containing protein [Pseudomonadota bacterium]